MTLNISVLSLILSLVLCLQFTDSRIFPIYYYELLKFKVKIKVKNLHWNNKVLDLIHVLQYILNFKS